jgi:deoxyribodipyrimidine photo-lyase
VIEPQRVRELNDAPEQPGEYVLYWMQNSQRADFNPALEVAIAEANRLGLPVLVGFGLTEDYPEANARHYAFMLEGLAETERLCGDVATWRQEFLTSGNAGCDTGKLGDGCPLLR